QEIGKGVTQSRSPRILGGAPPYKLAVTGGSLPAGLSLDSAGTIVGQPTTLGPSTFPPTITHPRGATSIRTPPLAAVSPPPAAPPGAPSNVTASAPSPPEVTVSWQDNASAAAGFQVQLSQDGGATFLPVQSTKPTVTTTRITNLSPATAYTFRVRAVNAA